MSDLIDRQAAIEIASGYCHPANIAKELEKLPSAERKKGKWIDYKSDNPMMKIYHLRSCSVCGDTYSTEWNFCPNCGADMRENNEMEDTNV